MNSPDTNKLFEVVSTLIAEAPQAGATDTLEKLARSRALTPAEVSFVATAFNKSKAVHMLKAAAKAQDPSPRFDLADPEVVLERIFGDSPKEASDTSFHLPNRDVSMSDLQPVLQKAAAGEAPDPRHKLPRETLVNLAYNSLQKYACLLKAVRGELQQTLADKRLLLDRALEDTAQHMRPLMPKQWEKVARLVVNGYPETGTQFMRLISAKLQREPGSLEKTAAAAVFPMEEPYLSIAKVHRYAQELAHATRAVQCFEKLAWEDSFLQDLASGVATQALTKAGLPSELSAPLAMRTSMAKSIQGDILDPEFFNRLKEMESKTALFDMLLYDPDIRQYKLPDVLRAFNDTLQTVPEASKRPAILRNLVLGNLETGGVKDPFRTQQELGVRKLMLETNQMAQGAESGARGEKKTESKAPGK